MTIGLSRNRLVTAAELGLLVSSVSAASLWRSDVSALEPHELFRFVIAIPAVVAIAIRRPSTIDAVGADLWVTAPSILVAGLIVGRSDVRWSATGVVLWCAVCCWTLWSILTLGRSFGVAPAVRQLKVAGPYQIVRHPIYLGEFALVMLVTCSNLDRPPSAVASDLALVAVLLLALAPRIAREERLLSTFEEWQCYSKRVRFRLVPHVW